MLADSSMDASYFQAGNLLCWLTLAIPDASQANLSLSVNIPITFIISRGSLILTLLSMIFQNVLSGSPNQCLCGPQGNNKKQTQWCCGGRCNELFTAVFIRYGYIHILNHYIVRTSVRHAGIKSHSELITTPDVMLTFTGTSTSDKITTAHSLFDLWNS